MKIRHLQIYCNLAVSKSVVSRALKVSFVVGTLLNIINQGDILLSLDISHVNFVKFLLTYLVPYGVTTYTALAIKKE